MRLADPRLSDDRRGAPPAHGATGVEDFGQGHDHLVVSDQRSRVIQAFLVDRPGAFDEVQGDRIVESLDDVVAGLADLEPVCDELHGRVGDPDTSGRRDALDTCRSVRGVTEGQDLPAAPADLVDDDGTRVDADVHTDRRLGASERAPCGEALLDRQPSQYRALGIVLMCNREAEIGDDAVALHLWT